jgi:hypothetical protein
MCIGNIAAETTEFRDNFLKLNILEKVIVLSKDINKPINLTRSCLFLISNLLRGKPAPSFEKVKIYIFNIDIW